LAPPGTASQAKLRGVSALAGVGVEVFGKEEDWDEEAGEGVLQGMG